MKIALDAKRALNNVAGLGQYSRILINGLLRDFPQHAYHLFSPKTKDFLQKEITGNYKIHSPESFFSKKIYSYWRSYGITSDLIKDQYDVFHGLSNELPLNLHTVKGLKKIVTIHDVIFLKHKDQYSALDRKIYDYKTGYAVKNAGCIITISEETKHDLVHYYKVPENKIEVIYQSCHPSFYSEESVTKKKQVKSKYQLPENYILNVSSFFSRKNHKVIVEAMALLKEQDDLHVVFIGGQGNIKEEIISLIKSKKLENRFHILSGVSNEDMPAIYQQASVFVYPSYFEGFGIPILEALFSKVPVITTKGGCFEEAGGNNSLYMDPSNAHQLSELLNKTLSDQALRNKMIQEGLHHASTMKDDVFTKKIMKIYED
jgi:glycosyltransferase involved in cell wall biosynthesis